MAACRVAFASLSKSISQRTPVLSSNFLSRCRVHKTPSQMRLCTSVPRSKAETVKVTFSLPEGETQSVNAKVGDNLLDVIVENDVDIDGFGACEGTLACSTCHLIFKPEDYDIIPDKPVDEELDMLDLAYGLTDTSRLGCQVVVTKDMEGLNITVPGGVADARSGGL